MGVLVVAIRGIITRVFILTIIGKCDIIIGRILILWCASNIGDNSIYSRASNRGSGGLMERDDEEKINKVLFYSTYL